MSDQARQPLKDKAAAALKPDSEKSTPEHVGDMVKGKFDSVASKVQPEDKKSTSQQVGDSLSSGHGESGTSLLDKAKDAVGLGDRGTK